MASFSVKSLLILYTDGNANGSIKSVEASQRTQEFSKLSHQDNFPKSEPSFGPEVIIKQPIFVTTPDGVLHVKVGEKHVPEITMENFSTVSNVNSKIN
ncbi:MAG: hypothetical protein K0R73_911 [Candidatus Midichloriaceae bacterium]|jgi:hypothetical protein|nr:hypothetical protein [Candidatus Midichloriaceae bacterium]